MFNKDLLDILACPLCKESVEINQNETFLTCIKCKRKYPIQEGIPVMLIDEAIIEKNKK